MKAVVLLMLASCAEQRAWETHVVITIDSIDRPLYRTTEDLLLEAEIEAQATLFARGKNGDGYRIIQDTNFIAAQAARDGSTVGTTTQDQRVVVPETGVAYQGFGGKWVSLPPEKLKDVLAHELGHAMGLVHTDHGLMQSNNWSCIGKEAKCLVEALREQGALP